MPLHAVGIEKRTSHAVWKGMSQQLRARADLALVSSRTTRTQITSDQRCAASAPSQRRRCAAAIAGQSGADRAISGALGRLGETYIVQFEAVSQHQRVLAKLERSFTTSEDALPGQVAHLALSLVPAPPADTGRPWYGKWWVWAAAGAVAVAAVAVTVPLALDNGSGSPTYVDLPLP